MLMGRIFFIAAMGILWSGCRAQTPASEPCTLTLQTVQADDTERLWEATLAVLRSNRFQIDRKDRQAGVITTFPETSQNWFEFWRHDVATSYDWAEASLQTTRRWVQVQIKPAHDGHESTVDVQVHKERFHTPERQVTNAAAALQIYGSRVPLTTGRRFKPETDNEWTDQGRDGVMEHVLLTRILDQYNATSSAKQSDSQQ